MIFTIFIRFKKKILLQPNFGSSNSDGWNTIDTKKVAFENFLKDEIYCASVYHNIKNLYRGQNQIFLFLNLRNFGGSNFRQLKHILTVLSSSSHQVLLQLLTWTAWVTTTVPLGYIRPYTAQPSISRRGVTTVTLPCSGTIMTTCNRTFRP